MRRTFIGAAIYGAGITVGSLTATRIIANANQHVTPRVRRARRWVEEKAEQRAARRASEASSPPPKDVTPRRRLRRPSGRP